MKTLLLIIGILAITSSYADDGQALFNSTCSACHTIGKGRLVGPDLKNISEKRTKEWLMAFISSSQDVINSGDEQAIIVYKEYNNLLMPDVNWNNKQINTVISFIKQSSSGVVDSGEEVSVSDILENITQDNISTGSQLFGGNLNLENKGPSCSSCHKVKDDKIFSSGNLAKELTLTYELMGSAGIAAILKNPPYPVMKEAYLNNPLTEEEILNLTGYLRSVSQNRFYQHPREYGKTFAIFGFIVFIGIILVTMVLYFQRKRLPVNHKVTSRQKQVLY